MAAGSSSIVETMPAVKEEEERKAAVEPPPAAILLTKERLPEDYIELIKTRPLRKMRRPLPDSIARNNPKHRQMFLTTISHIEYLVDLELDCLRQHAEQGYAEIGVHHTNGMKKLFILPQDCKRQYAEKGYAEICVDYPDGSKKVFFLPQPQPQPQPQVMMMQQ